MQMPLVNFCDSIAADSGRQDRDHQTEATDPYTSGSHVSHITTSRENCVRLLARPHRRFRASVVAKLIAGVGFVGLGRSDIDGTSCNSETQRRDSEDHSDSSAHF
jgi:hypothetical protein